MAKNSGTFFSGHGVYTNMSHRGSIETLEGRVSNHHDRHISTSGFAEMGVNVSESFVERARATWEYGQRLVTLLPVSHHPEVVL